MATKKANPRKPKDNRAKMAGLYDRAAELDAAGKKRQAQKLYGRANALRTAAAKKKANPAPTFGKWIKATSVRLRKIGRAVVMDVKR